MPSILKIIGGFLALVLVWFTIWHFMMADDVARVEKSLAYHQVRLKTITRVMQFPVALKVDEIYATGFPFKFQVAVKGFTMSMVETTETFAVSVPLITLEPTDSTQGIYRVNLPNMVEAIYAENGKAPEQYTVTADVVPKMALSAVDRKTRCGAMTGTRCADVASDAPLISYALGVPKAITLHMTLNGKSRDARFDLLPMDLNVPIYQEIPGDMEFALDIFVRMLREALVFKTPGNEIPVR